VPRLRTRWVVLAGALVLAVVLAVGIPLGIRLHAQVDRDAARSTATGFARAWQSGSLASVRYEGGAPKAVAGRIAATTAGLTAATPDRPAAVEVLDVTDPDHDAARARLRVRWTLEGGRPWAYETTAELRKTGGLWKVLWSPSLVHPALTAGQTLMTTRTAATRGRILGARREVLAGTKTVVHVGIEPGKAKDRTASADEAARIVAVDPGAFARRVEAAPATAFVEAITLRAEAYAPLAAKLKAVPGVVTQTGTLSLGRTAQFARVLLGSVGSATKEIVYASGGRVRAGDMTGLAGLQRTYDAQLAGTPGLSVTTTGGKGSRVIFTAPPTAGKNVTTTIDPAVQDAAEVTLGKATKPAGLVVIRPSTGDVLAVANGGPNAAGYDRALLGQYPPGSTFKVVSGYALLKQGYTATTPVPCPPAVTVDGLKIGNAENEVLGTVPFRTDFAQSCNAAFVGSRGKVTPQQLADASAALGYGESDRLGVQAFGGSVPTAGSEVEHAVDMIGQGKVLASPLAVATVSASVAAGSRVTPRLVLDPSPTGGDAPPASGSALDHGTISTLRQLMRAVVTEGTGTALKGVPGRPVMGKTGTAEFGTKNPPDTHAWFTGYQGDLAFAVIVEGGGFGAKVAAPLAADFLRRLA
jgi:cell division protein FtsI/penicillin-binding protein 2